MHLTSEPVCVAPFTSLYFDVRGNVKACCFNSTHPLGNVADTRLVDIWRGQRTARLRAALDAGDYGLGCEICKPPEGLRIHPTATARVFDTMAPYVNDEWPHQLEFSISNTCNLECEMCFGEFSSRIRSRREHLPAIESPYGEQFFEDLDEFLPHLGRVRFIGGEPFLAREVWRICERLDELGNHPSLHFTTNGTVRDRRLDWLFDRFPVSISVSLDGATAETYERIRIGARFDEVVANIDHFAEKCRARGTVCDLAFCLTVNSWRELPDLFLFADERGLGAGVNLVSEPARFSLWRAPADVLAEVADTWTARCDEVAARLPINGELWRKNVAWAQGAAADAAAELAAQETPVAIGSLDALALGRRLAREHAGAGPLLEVDLAADDTILSITGSEQFLDLGIDIDRYDLVGRPLIALQIGPILDRYGSTLTARLEDEGARSVRVIRLQFPGEPPVSVQQVSVPSLPGDRGVAFLSIRG